MKTYLASLPRQEWHVVTMSPDEVACVPTAYVGPRDPEYVGLGWCGALIVDLRDHPYFLFKSTTGDRVLFRHSDPWKPGRTPLAYGGYPEFSDSLHRHHVRVGTVVHPNSIAAMTCPVRELETIQFSSAMANATA